MKKEPLIFLILQRLLGFPFFLGLAIVGTLILFFRWIFNYIRYGGEAIAYTDQNTRKTIQDVFHKLIEQNK